MRPAGRQTSVSGQGGPVAYIVGAFPYYSETFIAEEILALERRGLDLHIFSLSWARGYKRSVVHDFARGLLTRVHVSPFLLSAALLGAQLRRLARDPLGYLSCWAAVVRGAGGRPGHLVKLLAIVPKCVRYAEMMEQLGVHHIHAGLYGPGSVAALLIGRLTGIPFSFALHGPRRFLDGILQEEHVRGAAWIVAISRHNRDLLTRYAPNGQRAAVEERIHVIHCGLDLKKFPPGPLLPPGPPWEVLVVSRLEWLKGLEHLVDALALLRGRGQEVHVSLIGSGPERRQLLRRMRERRVLEDLTLLGPLPQEELLPHYRHAHLFVLTSLWEGIPIVLMEAMASGLPVVATRITGIPELVVDRETGLLVPPGDPAALAEAIELLIGDEPLRVRLGARGREKVLREFDLEERAARLVALFEGSPIATDGGGHG